MINWRGTDTRDVNNKHISISEFIVLTGETPGTNPHPPPVTGVMSCILPTTGFRLRVVVPSGCLPRWRKGRPGTRKRVVVHPTPPPDSTHFLLFVKGPYTGKRSRGAGTGRRKVLDDTWHVVCVSSTDGHQHPSGSEETGVKTVETYLLPSNLVRRFSGTSRTLIYILHLHTVRKQSSIFR